MTHAHSMAATRETTRSELPLRSVAAYSAVAMPLAMAALPLYVHLPRFYGESLGVGLGVLGAILLVLRVLDGLFDPLLGALSDRFASRRVWIGAGLPVVAIGLIALFLPPVRGETALLFWLGGSLALVYGAFSACTINHGAWGAELSSNPVQRTRITAVRESLALAGVIVASLAPSLLGGAAGADAGLQRFALAFAPLSAVCLALTWSSPVPPRVSARPGSLLRAMREPLADPLFRKLLVVFMANGVAAAIPATLVLFFVADVLREEASQGIFLALYFIAGAAGMPLWLRLSAKRGKTVAWAVAMVASIVSFAWAGFLDRGDAIAFASICILSGCALGADLALPTSLLADVAGRRGATASPGAYFGVWTLATKLNLALAAGIGLPLLAAAGYVPGTQDEGALGALSIVYALAPCALKLVALVALLAFQRMYRSIE